MITGPRSNAWVGKWLLDVDCSNDLFIFKQGNLRNSRKYNMFRFTVFGVLYKSYVKLTLCSKYVILGNALSLNVPS